MMYVYQRNILTSHEVQMLNFVHLAVKFSKTLKTEASVYKICAHLLWV